MAIPGPAGYWTPGITVPKRAIDAQAQLHSVLCLTSQPRLEQPILRLGIQWTVFPAHLASGVKQGRLSRQLTF